MTVLERLAGIFGKGERPGSYGMYHGQSPVSPASGLYGVRDDGTENGVDPVNVNPAVSPVIPQQQPAAAAAVQNNMQQVATAGTGTAEAATQPAQAAGTPANAVDGVVGLNLWPEDAEAVRAAMNFEYKPEGSGYLQQLYESTRPKPQPLNEKQLGNMRSQAGLVDTLGLLAQFAAAATGGDLRERKFSETASGQAAVQEGNLREYYRKLQDDYEKGLVGAAQKDYELGYRNAQANRQFVQRLLNSDMNNRARLNLEAERNKNRESETRLRHDNTLREIEERNKFTAEQNRLNREQRQAQYEAQNALSAGRNTAAEKRAAEAREAQNVNYIRNNTVPGATLTPQRAIKDDRENMESFKNTSLLSRFPHAVISSEHRPGATTVSGSASRHSIPGGAIDIAPSSDRDGAIKAYYTSGEGRLELFDHGLGFLDETLPENRRWSRGNPAYHVGTDPALVRANNEWVRKNYPERYLASLPASQVRSTGASGGSSTGVRTGSGGTGASGSAGPARPYRTVNVPSGADAPGAKRNQYSNGDDYYIPYDIASREDYDLLAKAAQDALADERTRDTLGIAWDDKLTDGEAIEIYLGKINPSLLLPKHEEIEPSFPEPAEAAPITLTQEELHEARTIAKEELESLNSMSVSQVANIAKKDRFFLGSDVDRYVNINRNGAIHSYKLSDAELSQAYIEWISDPLNMYRVDDNGPVTEKQEDDKRQNTAFFVQTTEDRAEVSGSDGNLYRRITRDEYDALKQAALNALKGNKNMSDEEKIRTYVHVIRPDGGFVEFDISGLGDAKSNKSEFDAEEDDFADLLTQ